VVKLAYSTGDAIPFKVQQIRKLALKTCFRIIAPLTIPRTFSTFFDIPVVKSATFTRVTIFKRAALLTIVCTLLATLRIIFEKHSFFAGWLSADAVFHSAFSADFCLRVVKGVHRAL